MQSRQTTEVVLQAQLMAVWRRKPKDKVRIHSDQGSQFTSVDWVSFLKHHDLEHSMSRHDNAVAESVFNLLKRERIRRNTLQVTCRGTARCVRLHRDVLQPETQACKKRDAVARRVRKAAGNENRGRLENAGLFIQQASRQR